MYYITTYRERVKILFSELLFRIKLIGYNILFLGIQLFLLLSMMIFHSAFHYFYEVIVSDLKRRKKNGKKEKITF